MTTGIVIVNQYERLIKLRLGRYVGKIKGPGFHFLIPILETGERIDTREFPERVPTQQYITKDNVVVDMDFVLYYRVVPDIADKAVLEIAEATPTMPSIRPRRPATVSTALCSPSTRLIGSVSAR